MKNPWPSSLKYVQTQVTKHIREYIQNNIHRSQSLGKTPLVGLKLIKKQKSRYKGNKIRQYFLQVMSSFTSI